LKAEKAKKPTPFGMSFTSQTLAEFDDCSNIEKL
jgi:hypothetical protein